MMPEMKVWVFHVGDVSVSAPDVEAAVELACAEAARKVRDEDGIVTVLRAERETSGSDEPASLEREG